MYRVAVCEDEEVFRRELNKICNEILAKSGIEGSVFEFASGDAFLHDFLEGARFEVLLFDIMMGETTGIELARKVREHDSEASIIFITSTPDFAIEGYDVKALHYLMKPPDTKVLESLIENDYQSRIKSSFLVFKSGTQILRIPISEIICLETVGRRVEITLKDKTVEYSGKLSDLLEGKAQLTRCHKAFALNICSIRELTRTDAIAFTGKAIPVSRTYMKEVQQALLKQIRDE